MAHFIANQNLDILIHRHFVNDEGEKKEISFLLKSSGQLSRIYWEKTYNIEGASTTPIRKIRRDQVYTIYKELGPLFHSFAPKTCKPVDEDRFYEVYVFSCNRSVYQEPDALEPKPVLRSYAPNLFLGGLDMSELLFEWEDGEKERPFGVEFLEAFFDVAIPEGFEAAMLSEIHAAVLMRDDPKFFEEGEEFIKWLIHGEGLPEFSGDLRDYLRQNADIFRKHIHDLVTLTGREAAMVRGSAFLREMGENNAAYHYLRPFADKEKSGLACGQLARWFLEDDFRVDAFEYAAMGSALGNGQASYLAARLCDEQGLWALSRVYLKQGMDLGDGDCYALMAAETMRFSEKEGDHPFHSENPVQDAFYYADQGVQKRSPMAMVFLARLLLDFLGEEGAAPALQYLLRAKELGEKEALYRLAIYYLDDHEGAEGKNLDLAESYVKKAIIEEAYDPQDCQMLYADILLEGGNAKKAIGFLEELAQKGHKKSQIFLGQLVAGADERYPDVEDPIPAELRKSLKAGDSFYRAILWRKYPEIMPAKEAASILGELARQGDFLAFRELAKIHREGPEEMRDEKKAKYFDECFEKYRTR